MYEQKDSRIKVIHQENHGLVSARNSGIRIASGDYVGFVDSDDAISPQMYEMLLRTMQTSDCDVVACEYTNSRENLDTYDIKNIKPYVTFTGIDKQLAVLTCAPSIRSDTWAGPFVWNRLYRRANIKHLFRPEYQIGEDLFFNWEYVKNSKSMVVVPARLYFYRQNEEGISGQYRKYYGSAEKGISNVQVWVNLAEDPAYADPLLRNYIEARTAYMAHGQMWRIFCADEQSVYTEFVNATRQLLRDHFYKVWRDKETYSLRIRGLMGVGRYLFPLWAAAAKLYGLYQRRSNI